MDIRSVGNTNIINGGSGAANRVAYWTGANTLAGSANFTFDGTNVNIGGSIVCVNSGGINTTFVNPSATPFIIKSLTGNSNGLRLYSNTATDVASVVNGYNANLELGANNTVYQTISGAGLITWGTGTSTTHRLNTQLATAASDVLTLTNGPSGKAGNPAVYIQLNVNGTNRAIPAW